MDERLFTRLDALLEHREVVLASVLESRGAVPRRPGSRMLVTAEDAEFSVGGGLLEARVVEAARAMLASGGASQRLPIDLTGRPGAAGVCGGVMEVGLRAWRASDRERAHALATALQSGRDAQIEPHEAASDAPAELRPDERLLIVGGGHCALALYELARHLEFEIWVHDARRECFDGARFASATRLSGAADALARALDTPREVFAVLLNREYVADVAALDVLCAQPPALMTMMGSRKRIAEVVAALPHHAAALGRLVAPVGVEIDAETPHEIAVSILAQLVAFRRSRGKHRG